jgi:hypothetical protein
MSVVSWEVVSDGSCSRGFRSLPQRQDRRAACNGRFLTRDYEAERASGGTEEPRVAPQKLAKSRPRHRSPPSVEEGSHATQFRRTVRAAAEPRGSTGTDSSPSLMKASCSDTATAYTRLYCLRPVETAGSRGTTVWPTACLNWLAGRPRRPHRLQCLQGRRGPPAPRAPHRHPHHRPRHRIRAGLSWAPR